MIVYSPPQQDSLNIAFEDEYLLILNKPSGLLSVPGRGEEKQDCLISRVQSKYPEARIVHRLDMSTSGLIIVALGKEMERSLSKLFQNRQVKKHYIAIVAGKVPVSFGEISLPLITDWPNRPKQKIDFTDGKASRTFYQRVSFNREEHSSRIKLTPLTGRSHQLRIHMQSVGHAILGDELYAEENEINKAERLLLHASFLSFVHPGKNKLIEITSNPDF